MLKLGCLIRISKVKDEFCVFFYLLRNSINEDYHCSFHMLRLKESAGQVSELQQDLELVPGIHSSSETILVWGEDLPDYPEGNYLQESQIIKMKS